MKNFKATIAYDGRRYKGFRKMKGRDNRTIQGKLEHILTKLYEEKVEVISAVNTDADVHATCQVISFKVPNDLHEAAKIHNYMETFLPDDIIVLEVVEMDERFHARYKVKLLTYEYTLWKSNAKHRPLFERNQVKLMDKQLNTTVMEEAASRMVGEKDFRAFCTKSKTKTTVKRVEEVSIIEDENKIVIRMSANGFLLNMERIMVGTLVQIGLYERDVEDVDLAFETLDSKYSGHKAMAEALVLVDVKY